MLSTSDISNDSPEKGGDVKKGSLESICSLYICDLPESLMDVRLMRQHFSQFAAVERIYLSLKRRSCTVHFSSHDEADYARKHGSVLKGIQLNIFWSQPKSSDAKEKKLRTESDAAKRVSKRTRTKSVVEDITETVLDRLKGVLGRNTHVSPLRHKTLASTTVFQSCLRKSNEPIPFGTADPSAPAVGNQEIFSIEISPPQLPELENVFHSDEAGNDSLSDKKKKYAIKLAQKMVKNCKRKEMLLYRAKRSTSQAEDMRLSGEEDDITDGDGEQHLEKDISHSIEKERVHHSEKTRSHSIEKERVRHSEKARTRSSEKEKSRRAEKRRKEEKKKKSEIDLPEEVLDELKVMGGLDRMRVLERPVAVTQLPWKLQAVEPSEVISPSRWVKSPPAAATQPVETPRIKLSELDPSNPSSVAAMENVLRQPARTAEAKYQVLEARDALMKIRDSKLSNRKNNQGTCPDMCPEKERYLRKFRRQLDLYEIRSDEAGSSYHQYAVKEYARSSADQQMPMPHDLRPVTVLRMTMNYLIRQFMDLADSNRESLGDWYHFLWDRTRSIRKDITQQEICDLDSVAIVEQCARFHIFCSERLREEDLSVYDEKINTENLTKCLQTLKYMYDDLMVKGIDCPNEAEFQAYKVLLNLNSGSSMLEVQKMKGNIQHSQPIKFATKVYLALSDNNYVRFFKLVNSTTYLNACILHRYFHQVRTKAINTMIAAFGSRKRETAYPLADIRKLLLFDTLDETADFCHFFHLKVKGHDVILQQVRKVFDPSAPLAKKRSYAAIESKRSTSVQEIIVGGVLADSEFPLRPPHNSFDQNDVLRPEAWDAKDQTNVKPAIVISTAPKILVEPPAQVGFTPTVPVEETPKVEVMEEDVPELPAPVPQVEEEMAPPIIPVVEIDLVEREETVHVVPPFIEVEETPAEEVPVIVPNFIFQVPDVVADSPAIEAVEPEVPREEEVEEDESTSPEEAALGAQASEGEVTSPSLAIPDLLVFPGVDRPEGSQDLSLELPLVVTPERPADEEQQEVMVEEEEEELFIELPVEEEEEEEELSETAKEEIKSAEEEQQSDESMTPPAKDEEEAEEDEKEEPVRERTPVVHYANPDFTAWFSPLSLEEQARQLYIPGGASTCNFKEFRPSKRYFNFDLKQSWPDVGSIFVENVVSNELHRRLYDLHILEHEMFWKLVLSLPDPDESPKYCDALLRWADETFVQDRTKLKNPPQQVETLRLAREKTRYGLLNSSVQRIAGYLENSEPLQGASGVLMFVASDSEALLHRNQRLLRILEVRRPLPLLPVAVITDSPRLQDEDKIWLQQLVDGENISEFKIFLRNEASKETTTSVVETALKWLASHSPPSPNMEVVSLKLLWESCIVDDIWNRTSYLATKGIDWVNEEVNELIDIHNRGLNSLIESCTKDDLFQYSSGASEFMPFIKKSFYPPKVFINQILPEEWGNDEYKMRVREACNSAMIPCTLKLPPKDDGDLAAFIMACFAAYPEIKPELNHAIWLLCQNEVFGDSIKRAHVIQAVAEIYLARAADLLENEELIVAVRKEDLSAIRKFHASKFFWPAADVVDSGEEFEESVEEFQTPVKKPKLELQKKEVSRDNKPPFVDENIGVKAVFNEAKLKLAEMEQKIKENEISLKQDLIAFDMLLESQFQEEAMCTI